MIYRNYFAMSLLFLANILFSLSSAASENDILKARIASEYAQLEVSLNDGLTNLDTLVKNYIQNQNYDGSWSDINYQDIPTNGTPIRAHLGRLRAIAAIDSLGTNAKAIHSLQTGLDYWFGLPNRTNSNWWWNEIGTQLYLGPIAMMSESKLSNGTLSDIANLMPSSTSKQSGEQTTGANKTDLAKGVIWGGLLRKDVSRVTLGITEIESTIELTTLEGMQHDFSYQQHGPQLYTAGYGEVFFSTVSFWAYQVRDLQWAFSAEKIDLLTNYLLKGVRWTNYRGIYDYNTKGRGISRLSTTDPAKSGLLKEADYIAALRPEFDKELKVFKESISKQTSTGIQGFKSFWRSDYATSVGNNHFIGVRMNSNRTKPTESGNGENLLGQWLGFGSTFTFTKGDEYRNIFPVWDWRHVPGVTSPEVASKPANWGRIEQTTTFVGSVSNGTYGAAVMDMDYLDTKAKKAWFSLGKELVALGAGITSTHLSAVATTVEQSLLKGDVYIDNVKAAANLTGKELHDPRWVYHNNIGYVFPNRGNANKVLSTSQKTGSWNKINSGYSSDPVTEDVFELTIKHEVQPTDASYAYVILPDTSMADTEKYSQSADLSILSNSSQLQAVYKKSLKLTQAVFHQAGTVTLPTGSTLSVNKPSMVMVDESDSEPEVTISTPGVGMPVQVTLTTADKTLSTVIYTSSEKHEQGKSIKVDFSAVVTPKQIVLHPSDDTYVRNGSYADTNYGTKGYMVVKSDGNSYSRKALLQFDLFPAEPLLATKAKLRLYIRTINSDPSRTIQVSRLTKSSWSEKSVTWSTVPQKEHTGSSLAITTSNLESWVELDVSDLVLTQTGKVSFVIENNAPASGGSDFTITTKEGGKSPELVLIP